MVFCVNLIYIKGGFYEKGKDIKPYLNGTGIAILTTSNGIMTDKQARENNVGGEVLCRVW